MGKLLEELKRRKVFRVVAVYSVAAWVLIQVADTVLPALQMPAWTVSFVTILFILGFPIAVILAWAYEVTPEGIKSDSLAQPAQAVPIAVVHPINYVILGIVLLVAGFQFADRFLFVGQQSANQSALNLQADQGTNVMRASINLDQLLPRLGRSGARTQLAITADGSKLIYSNVVATLDGAGEQVFVKNLVTQQTRMIYEGTLGFNYPRISPDDRSVLLSSVTDLIIVPIDTGLSQTIVLDKYAGTPGAWLSSEEIVYTELDGSLHQKSLLTGVDVGLTPPREGRVHALPHVLPGGDKILYIDTEAFDGSSAKVNIIDLSDNSTKTIIEGGYLAQYVPSGHIVFLRDGALLAAPFDIATSEIIGPIVQTVDGIDSQSDRILGSYTISDRGRLVYLQGEESKRGDRVLVWVDRLGEIEEIPVPPGTYTDPELSPDGQSLALTLTQADGSSDIWVYDLSRETFARRTFVGNARNSKWTPDGTELVYQLSAALGRGPIWSISSDGSGQAKQILATAATPDSFSAIDGKLHYLDGIIGRSNINSLTFSDNAWISAPLVSSQDNIWGGAVSPNGRWIALVSDESDRGQVYVRPYPDIENGKWQISTRGGREPMWGPNGDELFFLTVAGVLMSVTIDGGQTFSSGIPQPLLTGFDYDAYDPPNYAVSNDGQRFIQFQVGNNIMSAGIETGPATLTVVENWFEELKRLAPLIHSECLLLAVSSTGQCNTGIKSSSRRFIFQCFSWPLIQFSRDLVPLHLSVNRKVCAFR